MKIKSLQLKNFKRFTDLTIQDIPESAKLVLLIGSNGSGKSSVFDAFERISTLTLEFGKANYITQNEYYSKKGLADYKIELLTFDNKIFKNDEAFNYLPENNSFKNGFYGRTSFRQIPRLSRTALGNTRFDIENNSDRPISFIDRDIRFENDLEHIFGKLLEEFFISDDSKSKIKSNLILPINEAFERIFGKTNGTKLTLQRIIPPLEGKTAQIIFLKGGSEFHYNQLSAGEKEVLNILINLVARKEYYNNTIFFFDEIDLHLNTKLQYNFLKEIVENWIPDNCQFWTASHSLGFIQYATDFKQGSVIDFDDLDFDNVQVLKPKSKDKFEIFEIAVSKSFIDKVVQGRKIFFSENTDTPFYNDLALENIFFFVANDKQDAFLKAKNHHHAALLDRDYLSDAEVEGLKATYSFLYFLPYYSIENLFFHPDNLEEFYKTSNVHFDKTAYINSFIETKNREKDELLLGILQARSGYPFYKENENVKKLKGFKENYRDIAGLLKSDDFETFYKIFPAKDYGKEIRERQNISKIALAKTNWFKHQIEIIIQ